MEIIPAAKRSLCVCSNLTLYLYMIQKFTRRRPRDTFTRHCVTGAGAKVAAGSASLSRTSDTSQTFPVRVAMPRLMRGGAAPCNPWRLDEEGSDVEGWSGKL